MKIIVDEETGLLNRNYRLMMVLREGPISMHTPKTYCNPKLKLSIALTTKYDK